VTTQTLLFVCCALNELFFIALYLLSFSSPYLSPSLLQITNPDGASSGLQPGTPAAAAAAASLLLNPYSAGALELARANKMDSFVPWIIAGVSAPVMAFKQYLNILQLIHACLWLAEGDIEARRAAGLPRRRRAK
jgi:CDP-diacylglycerol--inositol 3-phosphatidyltransferase